MPIQKQILSTGTFTDANGRKCVFNEKRLDDIIKNFNESDGLNSGGNPVPLCIAHPKSDTPAFGWVAKIFRKGQELWAEFKDVNEKMEKWLADKAFRNVSVALVGNVLRHVGVLGAWPPAVAAMKDFELQGYAVQGSIEFGDGDDFNEIELSEDDDDLQQKIFELLKDIKTNLQKGDNNMKTVEELTVELAEINVKVTGLETKVTDLTSERDTEKERADKAEEELASEKEKVTNLEKENKEHKKATEKIETEKADLQDSEAIDKLISQKKIMPGEKDALLMTMKGLRGQEEKEFELAEGKKEKMTPRDYFLKKQEERPELDLDDEVFNKAKKTDKPGMTKLEAAVKEKIEKSETELSYGDAMKAVLAENPEMNKPAVANEPA
jgi:hypothetical protein